MYKQMEHIVPLLHNLKEGGHYSEQTYHTNFIVYI